MEPNNNIFDIEGLKKKITEIKAALEILDEIVKENIDNLDKKEKAKIVKNLIKELEKIDIK